MNLDWNGLDQIRLIQGQDGAEIYFYDHTGMRMLAMNETDGLRFWFAESETHYALTGEQTRRYLHLFGEGPTLARVENSTEIELQYPDALQNLMFSLDTNSDITASFLYGPFGEVVYASGDEEHRRQFNGKENDALTGLRYYGYRYYDPLLLRWNSADPLYRFVPDLGQRVPQRMNLYAFSLNNPVRYYDADGRDPQDNQGVFGACKSGSDVCESPPSQDSSDESDEEEEEEEKQPEFLHEKVSHQPKLQTKVSANIIKGEGGKKNKSSKVTIAKIVWSVIEPLSKRWEGDDASLSAELRGPNASVQASYDDDGLELSSGAEAAGIGGCVETCSHISSFYDYCQSVCVGASVGASVNLKLGNGQTKLGASAGVSASVGGRIKQRTDSAAGLPNWPSSNHTLNIAGAALDIFTAIRGNVPLFPK
jgi:RHS repeat-associated protein